MTRVVLLMLFPLAVAAQENATSLITNQMGSPFALHLGAFPANSNGRSSLDRGIGALPAFQTAPKVPPPQKPKPAQPKKSPEPKPTIPSSMVGYIDNAIVGSQIRIRFDDAFHNNVPDRAEFFYAQCSCIPNGPGPNSVVQDLNFQQLYMHAEYAPTRRFSFFAEVPVRWIQPQIQIAGPGTSPLPNEAGLSDVEAGLKLAAIASSNQYLTFQLRAYFPSGSATTGLGTNHYSIEPALLFYQKLSDRLALEAQVGDWHPIGGSSCPQPCNSSASTPPSQNFAGDIFFYGVGPSYILYRDENIRFAPVVELVGWRGMGGFETIQPNAMVDFQQAVSADGTNIVNLKIGARTSIGRRNSFYVGFGQAVTHSVWYEHIARAEYRYSF